VGRRRDIFFDYLTENNFFKRGGYIEGQEEG
jgi:hypothetical protein